MGQQVLSWIGGLSATVAIIAAILKGTHWLVTRRKTLVAQVSCHPFRNSPVVEETFVEQKTRIRTAINEFFARNPSQPGKGSALDTKYEHARRLASDVEWVLLENLPYLTSATKGCWFASVQNTGDKKCTDIHLRLPGSVSAIIHHDKEEPKYVAKVNEIIAVGELRPKGRCDITAWTHTDVTDWDIRRVEVTHESGAGKVRGTWHSDRFDIVVGSFAKRSLGILAIVVGFFGLLFLLIWGYGLMFDLPKSLQREETPAPTSPVSPSPTQPVLRASPVDTTNPKAKVTPTVSPDSRQREDLAKIETAAKSEKKRILNGKQEDYEHACIALKNKDYLLARGLFDQLRRVIGPAEGKTSQASQLIDFQIYLTFLLGGDDSSAQEMMEKFQFTGDTPSLYYAQAAWEFRHGNGTKAEDWVLSARKIYSPTLNFLFAEPLYDVGWLTR